MVKGKKTIKFNDSSRLEKIEIPEVILGTSSLGNLYEAIPYAQKLEIVKAGIENAEGIAMFDTAGKYGAGLALEVLGMCLRELNIGKDEVIISNKLGWLRKPLKAGEPTFEKDVWKDLDFDAHQDISYNGMMQCFEQGNGLLGSYVPQLVSVHDPDEYLKAASNDLDRKKRFNDIKEAYRALFDLKREGKVRAVGVGAKDWKVIEEIESEVELDWLMFANSFTLYHHPKTLIDFIIKLSSKGKTIINSAVFQGGFLTGGNYFDYQLVTRSTHGSLFSWRDGFFATCEKFGVQPAAACVCFSLTIPGINGIALNSSSAKKTGQNFQLAKAQIPVAFWREMKKMKLLSADYPHLGD